MYRSNVKISHQKNLPKNQYNCEICNSVFIGKPYRLEFISLVGNENIVMTACRKCAYRETFGTKGMIKAMREKIIEQEKTD